MKPADWIARALRCNPQHPAALKAIELARAEAELRALKELLEAERKYQVTAA